MTNKMTKRTMITLIHNYFVKEESENGLDSIFGTPIDSVFDFLDHEIELLDNKSKTPKKPTKVQVENEGLKANILLALSEADAPVTIKELQTACPSIAELTPQRISALLTQLRKDKQVRREYVKKVAYFTLGAEDSETVE